MTLLNIPKVSNIGIQTIILNNVADLCKKKDIHSRVLEQQLMLPALDGWLGQFAFLPSQRQDSMNESPCPIHKGRKNKQRRKTRSPSQAFSFVKPAETSRKSLRSRTSIPLHQPGLEGKGAGLLVR